MYKPVALILLLLAVSYSYSQPVNDNACNATIVNVGFNSPFTNVGATVQTGEPAIPTGSCTAQGNWCSGETAPQLRSTVWFKFTVPSSGTGSYAFRVNGNAGGFDSQVALFYAATCADVTNGNAVLRAANDDSASSPYNSYMTAYCLTPSLTYYVLVDGYGSTTNSNFYLDIIELPHSYAVANAGSDQTVCYSLFPQVPVNGSLLGTAGSTMWTTTGDGYFIDPSQLSTAYVPGNNDKTNSILHLVLSTNDPAGNCPATRDTMQLTVIADSLSAGTDKTLCSGEEYILMNGQHFLFTSFSWSTAGDGYFDDVSSLNARYYPGATDKAGAYFDLVLQGVSTQCFNTVYDTVRIYNSPSSGAAVTLPADAIECFNDSIQVSPLTLSNYSSVIWSSDGDGTFLNSTAPSTIYIPGTADLAAGSVTLALSAAGSAPCQGYVQDEQTLTLRPQPEISTIIHGASYCSTDEISLSASVSSYSALTWSTSGDGTFSDESSLSTIYIPGPGDYLTGNVQIMLTAFPLAPCVATDSASVMISVVMAPTVSVILPAVACATDLISLNASASDYATINWSSSGDGSFDDAGIVKPVYTPGPLDIAQGFVNFTVIVLGNAPCNMAMDGGTVAINDVPMVNAGTDQQVCVNSSVSLNGFALNNSSVQWTTDGDGSFDDTTLLGATYFPGPSDYANGSVNLFVLAEGLNPCTSIASDALIVTFIQHAAADAGPDEDIVAGQTVLLDGFAENAAGSWWITTGDGAFDDSTLLNAAYTPGPSDLSSGTVTLGLIAADASPCNLSASDSMTVTIYPDALLAVKLYIEGISGPAGLAPLLYNTGQTMDQTVADTVSVVFHETAPPYNELFEERNVIGVNGLIFVNLPAVMAGNAYYIAIRHRNSIETWIKAPVTINSFGLVDYTSTPVMRAPAGLRILTAGSVNIKPPAP